jgi:hypothetical protein
MCAWVGGGPMAGNWHALSSQPATTRTKPFPVAIGPGHGLAIRPVPHSPPRTPPAFAQRPAGPDSASPCICVNHGNVRTGGMCTAAGKKPWIDSQLFPRLTHTRFI